MLLIANSSVFPYFAGKVACVRANRVAKTQTKCPLFCLRCLNWRSGVGASHKVVIAKLKAFRSLRSVFSFLLSCKRAGLKARSLILLRSRRIYR